ncbi:MAG TPA: hypothetical protein VEC37_11975 [Bacillota bacterium]|nr:hypothetical protein [Bacillota bacterium]
MDEAKTEYLQSNRVRGELNLNLAQAEVKYAWELSRNQNVVHNKQSFLRKQPKYYIPAVAASVVIFLSLGAGVYFQMNNNKPRINNTATAKTKVKQAEPVQPVERQPVIAHVESQPQNSVNALKPIKVAEHSITVQHVKVQPKAGKNTKAKPEIVKTEVMKTDKKIVAVNTSVSNDKITRKSADTQTVPVSVSAPVIQETAEPAVALVKNPAEKQRDNMEPPLKPAAISLIIDEEALTKEASFSLKNGK